MPSGDQGVTAVSGCIESDNVTFLLQDDSIYTVPMDLVELALPDLERDDIEGHILTLCNPTCNVRCTYRGSQITSFTFM